MDESAQLDYSCEQSLIHVCPARHRVVVAGRRGGKTTFALQELVDDAHKNLRGLGWYIGPTHDHAKDLAWEPLLELTDRLKLQARGGINVGSLSVRLRNGYKISIKGAEARKRLRGKGLNMAVLDEYADMDPKVWTQDVRPALSDRNGRGLIIGTPDGYNHFYDLYIKAQMGVGEFAHEWAAFQYTTLEGGFVDEKEIRAAREDLSARDFKQEYEASFESISGRIYHAFDRVKNVSASVVDQPDKVLLIGMDFNVNPMTATFSIRPNPERPRLCHTFDELVITQSNTEEMASAIKQKFPGREAVVFPDPTADSRSTNARAGETDYTILRSKGFKIYHPPKGAYNRADKYNTVNGMLCNADGVRNLLLSPKCTNLIKAFDGLCYKEGKDGTTNEADKSSGHDHITDAEAYMINGSFPMSSKSVLVTELLL